MTADEGIVLIGLAKRLRWLWDHGSPEPETTGTWRHMCSILTEGQGETWEFEYPNV